MTESWNEKLTEKEAADFREEWILALEVFGVSVVVDHMKKSASRLEDNPSGAAQDYRKFLLKLAAEFEALQQ